MSDKFPNVIQLHGLDGNLVAIRGDIPAEEAVPILVQAIREALTGDGDLFTVGRLLIRSGVDVKTARLIANAIMADGINRPMSK